MKTCSVILNTNASNLEQRALRFMYGLNDRSLESYPNIYTYHNDDISVISAEKLDLANETVYCRVKDMPTRCPDHTNLSSFYALCLEDSESRVDLGRSTSRAGSVKSLSRVVLEGTNFWLIHTKPVEFPVTETIYLVTQHRKVFSIEADGSTTYLGESDESNPIFARIFLIRPSDNFESMLASCIPAHISNDVKIPVCYKRSGDCLVAYAGVPFDEEWTQVITSRSRFTQSMPHTTAYLATNGDYSREDYQFSSILDGRKGKRHTSYENTRQPYKWGTVDILINPTARAEIITHYLRAPLIGEDISDFYARGKNELSN